MPEYNIIILPGDGIGPEVSEAAVSVLNKAAEQFGFTVNTETRDIGGASIDRHGTPATVDTLQSCRNADAVFLGAVGGPKWDELTGEDRPESGLLALRKEMGVYANLRPVTIYPGLEKYSPLKANLLEIVDVMVVRELTGGVYFGRPKGEETDDHGKRRAVDTMAYDEDEIRRITRRAFELARKRRNHVTSVDKANVLASSRLWRDVVNETAKEYPHVELEHILVDNCAMQLISRPSDFDVILTENMFGDILSDEAAMLSGSIGLLPSASLGDEGGLYEPVHGSAPDIAGQGKANPLAAIRSVAMMLRYTFDQPEAADAIEKSIESLVRQGYRCADLSDADDIVLNTSEMTEMVKKGVAEGEVFVSSDKVKN